jgi:hypothetical protein
MQRRKVFVTGLLLKPASQLTINSSFKMESYPIAQSRLLQLTKLEHNCLANSFLQSQ